MDIEFALIHVSRGDIKSLQETINQINVHKLEKEKQILYYDLKGVYHYYNSDLKEAIHSFQQCRVISSELGDFETVVRCLENIAMCYEELGRYKDAIRIQETLLASIKDDSDGERVAQILSDLAINYAREENYLKVLPLLKEALRIARKIDDKVMEVIVVRKIIDFYEIIGDEESMNRYEQIEVDLLDEVNKNLEF